MVYGIISDIHGNLEALNVALRELESRTDKIIHLGDIIGYGPDPNECCETLKKKNIPSVAGNHEKVVLEELDVNIFNPAAKAAILWTKGILNKENLAYLKGLPLHLDFPEFEVVHGSLIDPAEEYIQSLTSALPTFEKMEKDLLFVGHTHIPLCLFKQAKHFDGFKIVGKRLIDLKPYLKTIINPGAVGQPRDGDNHLSCALYDPVKKEVQIIRLEYNIRAVQDKMKKVGLPDSLISRLNFGI